MRKKRRSNKIDPEDPSVNIAELFRQHCAEGWSRRSFMGKIRGGNSTYGDLCKTNPMFKMVHDFYERPDAISVYTYQDGGKHDRKTNSN